MNILQSKQRLQINLQKDLEELQIRLILKEDKKFALKMLVAFRPNATLRQIKNVCIANHHASNKEVIYEQS